MEIIERIGRDLDKFDIVFALFGGGENTKEWAEQFMKSKELKKTSKKTLILSDMDLPYADVGSCIYRRISRDEAEKIEHFYKMYEFSDRLVLISDHSQYGSLLNYVKTGVMTIEEVIQTHFIVSERQGMSCGESVLSRNERKL